MHQVREKSNAAIEDIIKEESLANDCQIVTFKDGNVVVEKNISAHYPTTNYLFSESNLNINYSVKSEKQEGDDNPIITPSAYVLYGGLLYKPIDQMPLIYQKNYYIK